MDYRRFVGTTHGRGSPVRRAKRLTIGSAAGQVRASHTVKDIQLEASQPRRVRQFIRSP
jgi:hypothetical protein